MRSDSALSCLIVLSILFWVLFPSTIHPRELFGIAILILYLAFRVIRRIIGTRTADTDNNKKEAFWLYLAVFVVLGGLFALAYINNRQ